MNQVMAQHIFDMLLYLSENNCVEREEGEFLDVMRYLFRRLSGDQHRGLSMGSSDFYASLNWLEVEAESMNQIHASVKGDKQDE